MPLIVQLVCMMARIQKVIVYQNTGSNDGDSFVGNNKRNYNKFWIQQINLLMLHVVDLIAFMIQMLKKNCFIFCGSK